MTSIAKMTATPLPIARQTLLSSFEGHLFRRFIPNGHTHWIMPLGLYHRTRRRPGLQFCPECLKDQGVYLRRSWRLSLVTLCERHGCSLRDRCPNCQSPIHFHRTEMGDGKLTSVIPVNTCPLCRSRLIETGNDSPMDPRALATQAALLTRLRSNTSSLEYFEVWSHLLGLLASPRPRFVQFRAHVATAAEYPPPNKRDPGDRITSLFDAMEIDSRRRLLGMADWLWQDWPARLVTCARATGIRASDLTRDFAVAPEWYHRAVEPLSDARRLSYGAFLNLTKPPPMIALAAPIPPARGELDPPFRAVILAPENESSGTTLT
jgi:hypothetical protein